MDLIQEYGKELFSLLVPIVTWLLNSYFKAKAKLQLAAPHRFTFLVPEPLKDADGKVISDKQVVHTISHVVINSGRDTATNIELVFNWKPQLFNVWPLRSYEEASAPGDRYVMKFSSLSPGEVIGAELMAINQELPNLVNVRSDQCTASSIEMYPQPVTKPWQRRVATILMLSGMALVVYFGILLLQFLVTSTH